LTTGKTKKGDIKKCMKPGRSAGSRTATKVKRNGVTPFRDKGGFKQGLYQSKGKNRDKMKKKKKRWKKQRKLVGKPPNPEKEKHEERKKWEGISTKLRSGHRSKRLEKTKTKAGKARKRKRSRRERGLLPRGGGKTRIRGGLWGGGVGAKTAQKKKKQKGKSACKSKKKGSVERQWSKKKGGLTRAGDKNIRNAITTRRRGGQKKRSGQLGEGARNNQGWEKEGLRT